MNEPAKSINRGQTKGVSVHAGFPNAALDSSLDSLDLNRLLIRHPASTFFIRIEGNDWHTMGIFDGDIMVVDRALDAGKNDLVVWIKDDNFAVSACNKVDKQATVWGVVTATVHQFLRKSSGV